MCFHSLNIWLTLVLLSCTLQQHSNCRQKSDAWPVNAYLALQQGARSFDPTDYSSISAFYMGLNWMLMTIKWEGGRWFSDTALPVCPSRSCQLVVWVVGGLHRRGSVPGGQPGPQPLRPPGPEEQPRHPSTMLPFAPRMPQHRRAGDSVPQMSQPRSGPIKRRQRTRGAEHLCRGLRAVVTLVVLSFLWMKC